MQEAGSGVTRGPGSLLGGQGPKKQPLFTRGWTQMPWDSGIIVSVSISHAVFELQIKMNNFEGRLAVSVS